MKKALYISIFIFYSAFFAGCSPFQLINLSGAATHSDSQVGSGRGTAPAGLPTPAGTMVPIRKTLSVGDSIQQGEITFTLLHLEVQNKQTVLEYQVAGLADPSSSRELLSDPWLILSDGSFVALTASGGGGAAGAETAQAEGEALPKNIRDLTLVLPNNWTGVAQSWYIPIHLP
jgi:hypothetical protein